MNFHKALAALPALCALVAACDDGPGCDNNGACPVGEYCVFLSADADGGACIEPGPSSLGFPGTSGRSTRVGGFGDAVDVLLIVDNSPAMAGRQVALAAAMGRFADTLLALEPDVSLRVGVTTTDNGNPLCAGPGQDGALRAESCRARLDVFDDSAACTDLCSLAELALQPTAEYPDGSERVRPWIDHGAGGSNLPDGVGLADALRCMVPQGVTGCEFTSPLRSLERVFARAQQEDDPAFHFFRADAEPLIVFVTASNECSFEPAHQDIFVDNPTFWGDLVAPDLSPAVCWRAGVACSGGGPQFDACVAADFGPDGQPSADEPVLLSLDRTRDVIGELDAFIKLYDFSSEVRLFLIGGVPPDHASGAPIPYVEGGDPAFVEQHGIGPGCVIDGIAAPPPTRIHDLILARTEGAVTDIASICEPDLEPTFALIAEAAAATVDPVCYPQCIDDIDRDTPEVDPLCEMDAVHRVSGWRTTVPECVREGDAWVGPEGSPRCFRLHVGEAMDARCRALGYNLEVALVRGEPDPAGTEYVMNCIQSANMGKDCPEL